MGAWPTCCRSPFGCGVVARPTIIRAGSLPGMAFPAGVTGAQATASAIGLGGGGAWIELTITLGTGGVIVHEASGQRLLNTPLSVAGRDEVATPAIPHTDQAGFIDGAGNTVTNWHYIATITTTDQVGNRTRQRFPFQIPAPQGTVDLDLISGETMTPPITAPVVGVSSVAGLTGVVTVEELIAAGLGGGGEGGGGVPLDGSVTTPKLADLAVTTAKLNNGAATLAKLATGSVDSSKIVDGAIATGDLGDAQVTLAKLAAAVQTSLGKADSALQAAPVTSVATKTGAVVLVIADIGGLQAALDAGTTALTTKADLVGGVVPTAQIPAYAVTEYLGPVASQAAMLALTGQRGDWCTRTDLGTNWILNAEPASTLANWTPLSYPAAPVTSVNTQTGVVVLAAADVGARPAGAIPQGDVTNLVSDLSGKAPTSHTHTATGISDSTTVGRNVLTAADAATARTAIGAGTSDLALGTTGSTAKAGNYQPAAANISDSTAIGRTVLTAADAAAVRTAIAAANATHTHVNADITDGVRFVDVTTGSESRPSTSGRVFWLGGTSTPTNWVDGDLWFEAV